MGGTTGRVARWLALAVVAWSTAWLANRSARDVSGTSMLPALAPGDRVLVLPVPAARLRRGDVVVVRDPRDPQREAIKRVVGLPGEAVALDRDGLVVDGVRLAEPYALGRGADASFTVPAGHVVVLGDNRAGSTDSRAYGPVPLSRVVARVAVRVRPPGGPPHQQPRPAPG